ncbi:MAG: DUF4834 domain-containing protein [Cytophagales bacterium]|nr:DUF4834 domain-containing protein [Cytophagales bacterium]
MIKFLLIVFFISYILYKVGGFFFKILTLGGSAQRPQRNQPPKRPPGTNLNVDYAPDKKKKGGGDFKGGEYVDYEEVKE